MGSKEHEVRYEKNPNPHRGVPRDTPRTGVPVSPTPGNPEPPRHPSSGQFVKRPK
jgi:hypothetical protein